MMPLCTTETPSKVCGCAFSSLGRPWVAQRVWPMPTVPFGISAATLPSRFFSLPVARTTVSDVAVEHRHARRVIAAVLEPLEPAHQHRRCLLITDVANDSAHVRGSLSPASDPPTPCDAAPPNPL